MDEYNLTYPEALTKLMSGEGFIRSNIMGNGYYLKLDSFGTVTVAKIQDLTHLSDVFQTSRNSFNAKWKCFPVANIRSTTI